MQSIESYREDAGLSQKLMDTLAGPESDQLSRIFGRRRKAVEKKIKSGENVTIRETRNIGRNDPCPCGSGTKFKKCCGRNLAANDARISD